MSVHATDTKRPCTPRPSAAAALATDEVCWLSSVRPDGRPHLVAVWFHWDGERVLAFSKPHASKVENLRRQPRAMIAVGTPGPDFDVELIEASAELPAVRTADLMPSGFGSKYADLLGRAGLTVQRFTEVYSQPIVLRPTRFVGYGGRGWDPAGQFAT